MIRTIIRNNRMLFGPLTQNDLAVISQDPVFEGHGVAAHALPGAVEIYASLPVSRARQVERWFLINHNKLSTGLTQPG